MKIFRQITANQISLEEFPFKKELAMEAYLMENPSILTLDNDFAKPSEVLDAEIALQNGGTNNRNGRIDILAKYGAEYEDEYLAIAELKAGEINKESLKQLEGYLEVKEKLEDEYWYKEDKDRGSPKWIGILVGTSICPKLQLELQEIDNNNNKIPIATIILKRFKSDKEIFVISDAICYFYNKRDNSKYIFKKSKYGKGKLVLEVIKEYISENPNTKFSDLANIFSKKIQGSSGVFATQEKAKEIYSKKGIKRHFLKPDELISLSDSIIAVSDQWGIKNIDKFIDMVNKELGENYKIKRMKI